MESTNKHLYFIDSLRGETKPCNFTVTTNQTQETFNTEEKERKEVQF